MDELDEPLDDPYEDEADQIPPPTWRATIRGTRLMLTDWSPHLICAGPLGNLFPERARAGITIADLTLHGDDDRDVSVRFHALAGERDEAERVLVAWAADVGHRRIWLADRLVTLEPDPERIGTASARCPTCRARWSDSTPEFWLTVKQAGAFPKWCPMCGCELPQWTVSSRRPPGADRTATRRRSRPSASPSKARSKPS